MPAMRFAHIGHHFRQRGLAQPAGREAAQNAARVHLKTEFESALFTPFAFGAAFSGDDEEKSEFADARDADKGEKGAMRIALGQAVEIEPCLRLQLAAAQPLSGVAINSDGAARVRLWSLRVRRVPGIR